MDEDSLRHFMFMAASTIAKNDGDSSSSKLHVSKSDPSLSTLAARQGSSKKDFSISRETTVMFNTTNLQTVFPVEKISKEDQSLIWYTKEEITALKRNIYYEHSDYYSRSCGSQNISFSSTQEEIDQWVGSSSSNSNDNDDEPEEDRCVRGLEGSLCDTYSEERSETGTKILRAVLNFQREASRSSIVDTEMLRLVSVKISRPSRRIARMMGKADAKVVGMSQVGPITLTSFTGSGGQQHLRRCSSIELLQDESTTSCGGLDDERESESSTATLNNNTKRRNSWSSLMTMTTNSSKNQQQKNKSIERTTSAEGQGGGRSKPKKTSSKYLKSKLQKMIGGSSAKRVQVMTDTEPAKPLNAVRLHSHLHKRHLKTLIMTQGSSRTMPPSPS